VTFVVVLLTAGVRAAPGVLIVPLEEEFHWSRATISFAIGVNLLLYGAVGPFAAALMDRFGVRRTMTWPWRSPRRGRLSPAMHRALAARPAVGRRRRHRLRLYRRLSRAYIAARWFKQRQGLVVGVLTAANAAGQLVFLPTMAALATEPAGASCPGPGRLRHGVRAGAALLMRDRPEDLGLAPTATSPGRRADAGRQPDNGRLRALSATARNRAISG
jgi:hypothetical protein